MTGADGIGQGGLIDQAASFLAQYDEGQAVFGGAKVEPLADEARDALLADVLPWLRGRLGRDRRMIATWLSGLCLVATPGIVDWSLAWPWVKAACVLAMSGFHGWCAAERQRMASGTIRPGRRYRLMNEVPTLLMIGIVLAVIVKF